VFQFICKFFCGEISISSVVNVLQTSFDSLSPAEKSGHICSVKNKKIKNTE